MHVLMLTQKVSRADPLLGFAHGWITELASRVRRLTVICLEEGDHDLPGNVRVLSMGKERNRGRAGLLVGLIRALAQAVPQADVVFGHMIPRYTLVAAPFTRRYGLPIVQWYTHRNVTAELRIVHRLADRIVTASPESYGIPGEKVIVLGHGIDMAAYAAVERAPRPGHILAVGRLSPIKNYEVLLDAFALLLARTGHGETHLTIAGGPTPEHGEAYARSLYERAERLGITRQVSFLGAVPHDRVAALYAVATATTNLCPTGGVDKAVLESFAAGVPAVVHNATFLPLLAEQSGLLHAVALTPEGVAGRLEALLRLQQTERDALGLALRERMRDQYGLSGLIGRLVGVFEQVIHERQGGER
ncbi:MAG: glycosyltransferase family 4 protein [Anaerolineae bacterium]|nr:glycosyltransferase family 4 protein [Anaerolineae bacterium]